MAEAKFYLMTDSPCDFTQQMVDDANIGMFHFTYTEAGKEDGGFHGVDDLFVSRTPHEFYEAIRHGAMPMTSQPAQMEFERRSASVPMQICRRSILRSRRASRAAMRAPARRSTA